MDSSNSNEEIIDNCKNKKFIKRILIKQLQIIKSK